MDLKERCDVCDGRGFLVPRMVDTDIKGEPPRTEWCEQCKRLGWRLTVAGEQILAFVDAHIEDYREGRIAGWS